ncbi:isopeptide-forming domain-containing fimbrial protein [Enterococcus sp. BWB1-3]|uniref:isopeptide-forming domain-containing fimbrial protein n=1 Tax=Enterococcus sp. BWB1-3 TaxID=2787713 RepID=UPI00192411E1|nr:isopeptide-forming domain-containing fimbrial protein [Enterococcus sp. BWB1-3]MBL1229140.1 isopeptide-forming domain-containing fimbrial protein [Enterococcus sp. BWB1-3]
MKIGRKLQYFIKAGVVVTMLFIFLGTAQKAEAGTVTSWAEFVSELQNPDISEITLGGPITKPTGGATPGTISRDITINGNGNTINFFTGTVNGVILGNVGSPTTLTLNNVDLHKYTTPATAVFSGNGTNWTINLNSVTTGTQTTTAQSAILDAVGATVNISGTTKLRMQSNTDIPHIKAASLNILDGADVTFAQTSNRHGGAFQGNTVTVGENATVDLGTWTTNGAAANYNYGLNAATSVVLEEGASVKTGTISANYTRVINTGSFTAKTNSTLEAASTSTYATVIATAGDITIEDGATVKGSSTGVNNTQIDAAGSVNVLSGGTLDLTASGANTTQVKAGAAEFIVRNGANLNIEYTNTTNTTSYSFYVNKFIVEDNTTFKLTPTGTGHRIYGTGFTVGKGADVEITSNSANSDAVIFLMEEADVLIKEDAKVAITNNGTSTTVSTSTNYAAGAQGSHGIYGLISSFTMEANSTLDLNANTIGYWVRGRNSLTMSDGAVFNAYSRTREALALCYDFGDGANANTPSTINISGEGTQLNMDSGNTSMTANNGATMRVQGDGAEFNLSDGAELNSKGLRTSALQIQSLGSVFNVRNGAKLKLLKDSTGVANYDLGSALRFRIRGAMTFNIDNAVVDITSRATTAFGIRMYGDGNGVNVTNGGQLRITNEGYNGSASNNSNGGIEYTGTGFFYLEGKDSLVDITAADGPAIFSTSALSADVGPGTNFILEGRSSSANSGGAIEAGTLTFDLNAPKYFDMRNNRPGGGYTLSGGPSSRMTSTQSDLSVWKVGSNLNGNPFRSWSIFDYTLTGADFVTIASTNVPDEFNTTPTSYGNIGARAYSRMSANNASAIIDELRIPTNADKFIFGHASVPEGLDDIRDAWTDEVYIEVQVYNPDGSPAFKTTGASVGKDDTSPGLSVYGEDPRGGIFVIPIPDGQFAVEGMTAEVIAAWRGGADSTSDRVHTSEADDILAGTVKTIDVTPPVQVVSSTDLTNATKQISGTGDENGAKVFVKLNNEWLEDSDGNLVTTTVANGQWLINLPAYVEEADKVDVYLKDNTLIDPVPEYVLPVSYTQEPDGIYGNINKEVDGYDAFEGYHDAVITGDADYRFDKALRLTANNVIPEDVSLVKDAKVYRKDIEVSDAQVGDTVEYSLTAKNLTADTFWNAVVLTDVLPSQVDFDLATADVKIDGTAVTEDQVEYDEATRTLSVKVGDITTNQVVVTFNVKINTTGAGATIINKAIADGESLRETPFVPGPVNPDSDHEPITTESNENKLLDVYGTLSLVSAPNEIDFGTKTTGSYGAVFADQPTFDTALVVNDSRATASNWTLTATVTKVMTSVDDENYTLPTSLKYKNDDGIETMGLDQAVIITQQTAAGDYNVSQSEWENKDNGFVMDVSATQYRKLGEYQAVIEFTVADTFTP